MRNNGELVFVKSQIQDCTVVFDVGANLGAWTKHALSTRKNEKDLMIHCFEPIKAVYERFVNNVSDENVICNNIGLSSERGHRDLYLDVWSLYKRTGLKSGWGIDEPKKTETVELDTLDNYCEKRNIGTIDFLKLDVEGHELEVLKGATRMLEPGNIKRLQFEYGGCFIDAGVFLKDFFELFSGLDYLFYKIMPRGLMKIPEYDQRLENFQYKNFAVFHKSATPG